jgi:hypothetical protein
VAPAVVDGRYPTRTVMPSGSTPSVGSAALYTHHPGVCSKQATVASTVCWGVSTVTDVGVDADWVADSKGVPVPPRLDLVTQIDSVVGDLGDTGAAGQGERAPPRTCAQIT